MERNRNYRREVEKTHFKKRKKLFNEIKEWNINDEEIKRNMESPLSLNKNEWWYNDKKSKKVYNNKQKIRKEIEDGSIYMDIR